MHISDYDYDLPKHLIAQQPLPERDASRLLVVDRAQHRLAHREFSDLPDVLEAGDRIVVNDTRVIPARLFGRREGATGTVEVLLLHPVPGREGYPTVRAVVRPARKLPAGTELRLGESKAPARIVREIDDRTRHVEFEAGFKVMDFLNREGHMPLPPYIQREDEPADRERYQTVFAKRVGGVAAPTAGLHFTDAVLERIRNKGIGLTRITLHVGPGTFTPIQEQDPREHAMEAEFYDIPPEAVKEIMETKEAGRRCVAVGTTVVRALETAADHMVPGAAETTAGRGWTEKFIYPPYTFQAVDALVTNFHLPRSTLLVLVCAFGGLELVHRAYHEAINHEYRFYSYGDAMLIL